MKNSLFQGRNLFLKVKIILVTLSSFLKSIPASWRYTGLVMLMGVPSIIGVGLRYIFLRSITKKCGDNVAVFPHAYLSYIENLSLGNNISIRELCHLGCMGGLTIEDDVSIGHGSTILTTEHDYMQTELPIRNAPLVKKPTHIKRDVWIGCHVTVLAGVTIGEGAVIGAGAVVTKSIPDYAIAVGVPAQVKSFRHTSSAPIKIISNNLDGAGIDELNKVNV